MVTSDFKDSVTGNFSTRGKSILSFADRWAAMLGPQVTLEMYVPTTIDEKQLKLVLGALLRPLGRNSLVSNGVGRGREKLEPFLCNIPWSAVPMLSY